MNSAKTLVYLDPLTMPRYCYHGKYRLTGVNVVASCSLVVSSSFLISFVSVVVTVLSLYLEHSEMLKV
jgi:hypothetical protein